MSDPRNIVRAHMAALVQSFGCLDAAAATLDARWGGGSSKGTLSKKMAGHLDWTVTDVLTFEDALGRYPVSEFLHLRRQNAEPAAKEPLAVVGADVAKEAGEAIAAIFNLMKSESEGRRVITVKETHEAIEALQRLLAVVEGE